MVKRFLDCSYSDLKGMTKNDKLVSLKLCEGRILFSESICTVQPLLHDITNAELASSQGADVIILNKFDVLTPVINGLPTNVKPCDVIKKIKELTGRLVAINLEPMNNKSNSDKFWEITPGRAANVENALIAKNMGVDIILVTSNPGNQISNSDLCNSLSQLKSAVGNDVILISGKMHAGGLLNEMGDNLLTTTHIKDLIDNGADIIMLPAPGTVPGITTEKAASLILFSQAHGAMTLTTVGTSQEGADIDTIRNIALMAKMSGTDLHHIGDSGFLGIALPENIHSYSIVIRGRRHTYSRMARSILR